MHFDTSKQFFSNEKLLNSLGVNSSFYFLKDHPIKESFAICPCCKQEVPANEIKADGMCDSCFREEYVRGGYGK